LGIQCTIKSIRYAKIFYKKRKEKKKQIRGQLSCVKFRKSGINGWAAILSSPEKAPIQLLLAEKKKKKKLNHCQLLQNANTYFYSLYNLFLFCWFCIFNILFCLRKMIGCRTSVKCFKRHGAHGPWKEQGSATSRFKRK
jgi:hypothetical protein